MDPEDSLASRAHRTFWTLWNYITESVNRFLRPEPPVTTQDDPKHLDTGNDDAQEEETHEDVADAALFVSPTRPVVRWDSGSDLQSETTQHTVEGEIDEIGIDVARSAQNSCTFEETDKHQNIDLLKEIEDFIEHKSSVGKPGEFSKTDAKPTEHEEDGGKAQNDCKESKTVHTTIVAQKEKLDGFDECTNVQSEKREKPEDRERHDVNMTNEDTACDGEDEDRGETIEFHVEALNLAIAEKNSSEAEVAVGQDGSKEEINQIEKNNEPVTSLALETEHLSHDETLVQPRDNGGIYDDEKSNVRAAMVEGVIFSDALPHADLSTCEKRCFASEESERVEGSTKSESDDTEEFPENNTEGEVRDNAFELVLKDVTKQQKCLVNVTDSGSDVDIEDMGKDDLKMMSTPLGLDEGVLEILDEQPVQSENRDAQMTDENLITQEGTTTGKEHHSEAQRNEKCVFEEEVVKAEKSGNTFNKNMPHNAAESTNVNLEMQSPAFCTDPANIGVSSEGGSDLGMHWIPVNVQGSSTQEEDMAFGDFPLREGGQDWELHSYKESGGEVPDHNNEPYIGSATQRFLEEGNCKENQTTLLQEEVESAGATCLQNRRDSAEGFMEAEADDEIVDHCVGPEVKTLGDGNLETEFFIQEDLTQEAETELQMGESLCEVESVADARAVQGIEAAKVTESTHGFMLSIGDNSSSETEYKLEEEQLEAAVERSNEEQSNVDDRESSPNTLSDENVCQSNLEHLICCDVIEEDILDLWIKQTSTDSFESEGEATGQRGSPPELRSTPELNMAWEISASISTSESGFFDQTLEKGVSDKYKNQELQKTDQLMTTSRESQASEEAQGENPVAECLSDTLCTEDLLRNSLCATPESTEWDSDTSQTFNPAECRISPVTQADCSFVIQIEDGTVHGVALFQQETLKQNPPFSPNESENTMFLPDPPADGRQLHFQETPKQDPLPKPTETFRVEVRELDFTPQKSRIALKNPRSRPPKDPRSLLQKPSLEPSPSKHMSTHRPAGVLLGGLGIGIKLPGLGAGFPDLKKTKKLDESEVITEETSPAEEGDESKPEFLSQRPKWMPPNHPGVGNPFMSELRSKLKKTE